MAVSKGVWFDTKAGKVVESQPEEGVQLIAPGVEPSDADLAAVEAYKTAAADKTVEKPVKASK